MGDEIKEGSIRTPEESTYIAVPLTERKIQAVVRDFMKKGIRNVWAALNLCRVQVNPLNERCL